MTAFDDGGAPQTSGTDVPKFNTWKVAWHLARSDQRGYIGSLARWLIFHQTPLVYGALASYAVTKITENAPASEISWPLIWLLIVAVLRAGSFYNAVIVWTKTWGRLNTLMRTNLMSRVVRGEKRASIPESPGEAVSRLRDDADEYVFFLDLWVDALGAFVFSAIAIFVLAQIDPHMTMFAALPMVGTILVVHFSGPTIRKYRRVYRRCSSAVAAFIGESMSSAQSVKVAGAADDFTGRFAELGEARRKAALKDRLLVELVDAVNSNLANIATGVILLFAASTMRRGEFTMGQFVLFLAYIERLVDAPRWAGRLLARAKHSYVSMGRMARMLNGDSAFGVVEHNPTYLEMPDPVVPAPLPVDALQKLSVNNITCAHSSGRGVSNVQFEVERGEFVVLTGKIGSGKTTVLRALLGLADSQQFDVTYNGSAVTDPLNFFVPPRCAYTPQVPRLFSETLEDNIVMGTPGGVAKLDSVLQMAVFEDDLAAMSDGLQTVIGPRGVRLSGGQVQRAAAARMFIRGADLMVFDDLSSALDVHTEAQLWSRVFAAGEKTCLVVSHRRAAWKRADRIILLDEGHVSDTGKLEELLDRSPLMRDLWDVEHQPAPA